MQQLVNHKLVGYGVDMPTNDTITRPYNYFQVAAVDNLLKLLGITDPAPEQIEQAYRFTENQERFVASKAGH